MLSLLGPLLLGTTGFYRRTHTYLDKDQVMAYDPAAGSYSVLQMIRGAADDPRRSGCQTFNPMPLRRGELPAFRKHTYLGEERLLEVDPQNGDFRVLCFNRTVPCSGLDTPDTPATFGQVVQKGRLLAFVDADLITSVGQDEVLIQNRAAAAFSIAASLMCMIYALGDVSGAHFNPAVTLAILTCGRDKITPADAGAYMGAQVAGGISAGFTYKLLHGGASFALQPIGAYTWGQAGVAEIIFTFVLCFVVLSVAISEKTAAPEFFGLAIGSCVTVGGFAIGGVSGGSLNPAVSLGISCSHLGAVWTGIVYALFEFTGAFVASTAFKTTHAVDVDKESDKVAA